MSALWLYILAFISVVSYAFLPVYFKKLQMDIPPMALISLSTFMLAILAAIGSFCVERNFSLAKMNPKILTAVGFASAVNFVAFLLLLYAVEKIPVAHYQLMGLATPIIGGVFAYFLLGEQFKTQYWIGLAFIAIGLFIALREGTK